MLGWEGRILDNKSILMIKAALPFFDIPVGETIDLEGLLRAIRCFCQEREQKIIDMLLNLFMMKRVFSMMSMFNELHATGESGNNGMDSMLELLKSQMPKEQQEMFEMMSMMMSAAGDFSEESESPNKETPDDSEEHPEEEGIPDIWRSIVGNNEEGNFDDRPQ